MQACKPTGRQTKTEKNLRTRSRCCRHSSSFCLSKRLQRGENGRLFRKKKAICAFVCDRESGTERQAVTARTSVPRLYSTRAVYFPLVQILIGSQRAWEGIARFLYGYDKCSLESDRLGYMFTAIISAATFSVD